MCMHTAHVNGFDLYLILIINIVSYFSQDCLTFMWYLKIISIFRWRILLINLIVQCEDSIYENWFFFIHAIAHTLSWNKFLLNYCLFWISRFFEHFWVSRLNCSWGIQSCASILLIEFWQFHYLPNNHKIKNLNFKCCVSYLKNGISG